MLNNFVRAVAGVAMFGLATALAGCDAGNVSFNGKEGVPLADLDLTGPAPTAITLLGPDNVRVTRGDKLAITVEGADSDKLRFALSEGQLGIAREGWKIGQSSSTATVNVTLPLLSEVVLAGSGNLTADQMGGEAAKIVIAGSGAVEARAIDTTKLGVDVVGSGKLRAAGKAKELKMTVAGSGDAEMDGLNADVAKVDVAGSGNARFASNGIVDANIMGSGEVRVFGRATCKVSAMGSGKLVCANGVTPDSDESEAAQ
ncbi:head GIN domain-containing protein [Novosphingobium sp. ERN07]|uniref:head GIN domain-containing protein n=1 Tax=Novosphingobium sp. ERN07 TaxID=2726187 RepID=UPI001F118792|nr:head GIN domain-containing protein [Novosphingobium sp. ERN07]